jgi:hypothetical protein
MNKILFAFALFATFGIFVAAQDFRISPPLAARKNPRADSTEPRGEQVITRASHNLPFCPPKTCLYYAGDFDSTNSAANGLLNYFYDGGDFGQVWVGVKPPKTATATGVTFNEFFTFAFAGTNPTPFQTQFNIVEGSGGILICNTSGTATMKQYGESDFGYVQYSYTVKKLKGRCKVQPGSKGPTYVSLLPTTSNDSDVAYLVNVEDARPKNHRGWKNDRNDCYLNGDGEYFWETCDSQGIGSTGFSELSIALTGEQ